MVRAPGGGASDPSIRLGLRTSGAGGLEELYHLTELPGRHGCRGHATLPSRAGLYWRRSAPRPRPTWPQLRLPQCGERPAPLLVERAYPAIRRFVDC